MHLPSAPNLKVNLLTACFNNTSATYKFYWFLSILEAVDKEETAISKWTLFSSMVANAWYTVHYFRVSFGKQDKLQDTVRIIKETENLPIDAGKQVILSTLSNSHHLATAEQLRHFDQQVPHRFLSPWLQQTAESKSKTEAASQRYTNDCLYALYPDKIIINPAWVPYLQANSGILKDFCYWNLARYLQAKNPSVPDIPNKLLKPLLRNSLAKQRNEYWNIVLGELQTIPCIYTGKPLSVGNYAVEHFIPYNFVSHNQIWNLIPADTGFNSTKSDKLPPFDRYFDGFFRLQQQAISIVSRQKPGCKWLEDYLTIWPQFNPAVAPEEAVLKEKFRETVRPLLTIAANNGFLYLP